MSWPSFGRAPLGRLRRSVVAAVVAAATVTLTVGTISAPPATADTYSAGNATMVAQLTGPFAMNDTVGRYQVWGTDLGILWDNGNGQILAAFGDTKSLNGWSLLYGDLFYWRSNFLLRSTDRNLAHGMTFSSHAGPPGYASRLLKPNLAREITVLPTAGVAANGKQYMNVMAVRQWGQPGEWFTRWSGLVVSGDNGNHWAALDAFRPNGGGNRKFQMGAFLKVGHTIYSYGTPDGRNGAVYLSRVDEKDIEHLGKYDYFSYGNWVRGNPDAATPVMGAPTGEMSVAWNDYLGKYVSLASRAGGAIMRTADNPWGPWTQGEMIAPWNNPYTGYAPYIHPWSSGDSLYFTYSISTSYQVYLMRLQLRRP
ncbi:DUF4185 domain-containing protein [Gordonia sp. NPDC003425]